MAKRTRNQNSGGTAAIRDLKNGKIFEINSDEPFNIGGSRHASLMIKDDVICRKHSIITFDGSQFIICDNLTSSGTFVNYQKIKKIALKNGDVISYASEHEKWKYVYIFYISLNDIKRSREDKESTDVEINTTDKMELAKLAHAKLLKLKIEKNEFLKVAKTLINNVSQTFNHIEDLSKLSVIFNKMVKLNDEVNKMTERLDRIQRGVSNYVDHKMKQLNEKNEFQDCIIGLLYNHLECKFCNNIVIQPYVSNSCTHIFCKACVLPRMEELNNKCPECDLPLLNVRPCFAIDNYLTNQHNLLGGDILETRLALQRDRSEL